MLQPQFILPLATELVIDLFAGGGGASTGIEAAIGRHVDIAVNHDREAVSLHQANHPQTKHYVEDVFAVDPLEVTEGLPVGLLWASPDCTYHSKARGGKPHRDRNKARRRRGLAGVVVKWAAQVHPRVICLENVEEWKDWGPLLPDGTPCPDRRGQSFLRWVASLRNLGYVVEWREIRADRYGTPTIRKRLYVIARCDGEPIVWPAATHGKGLKPLATAAECIDWSIEATSIFARERPLAHNTLRRLAKGAWKHVLINPQPYIVGLAHGEHKDRPGTRSHGAHEPLRTIHASGGNYAVAQPVLVPFISDQSRPLNANSAPADSPLRTQCANVKGGHFNLVAAALLPLRGTSDSHLGASHSVGDPISTISASGTHHALMMAHFEQANGGFYEGAGRSADAPLSTITTAGSNQQLVTAYFVKYYGNEKDGIRLDEPMHTIPTKDRFGLVQIVQIPLEALAPEHRARAKQCADLLREHLPEHFTVPADLVMVNVRGAWWALVDITLRMLQPAELYRAQGFPKTYIHAYGVDPFTGVRFDLTKTAQVRMVGNSVCPPVAAALVKANYAERVEARELEAA